METATAVLEEQSAATTAATVEEPKKPGVIEQAMAGLRSKAALNSEIAVLKGQLTTAQARVTELEGQVTTLSGQVSTYQQDHSRLEQVIKEAAEEKQTVDEAAAAKIASIGIVPSQLPAAGQDAQDTADSLRDKLKTEKDPKERYRIQQRIDTLESANF